MNGQYVNSLAESDEKLDNMPASDHQFYGGYHDQKTDPIDYRRHRFPHCIVWTPIPLLSWLFPFIGHMGIAMSNGVIRDFAGPFFVSEDDMGFGWPTKYWQLSLDKVDGGAAVWDKAVAESSEEYRHRNHNLCCDNCHSHVAMALNMMNYGGSRSWNMVSLTFCILVRGGYVGACGFLKQWLPFLIILAIVLCSVLLTGVYHF